MVRLEKNKIRLFLSFFICISFILFFENKVLANETEAISSTQNTIHILSTTEIFNRTQAVLNYFHVPPEPESQPDLNDLKFIRSYSEVQQIMKLMDPTRFFSRLSEISATSLNVFQDFDSKKQLDLSVQLRQSQNIEPHPQHPLQNLKIAIDPGHMGGKFWDNLTGKFAHDSQGRILSEGVINLQTSLLLKAELEKLGAIVFLTHDDFKPVTDVDYKTFDIKPYALSELRESIHKDWFQTLIASAPVGEKLFRNFENSSDFRKLFAESSRDNYFIKREDLWKRTELIDRFQPDLVLIIHYDTADLPNDTTALNPKAPRQTKSFVFGSYEASEFGSRESRKFFTRHLLDKNSFDESVLLSRYIVKKMQKELNLDLPTSADLGSTQIEPGIFARNLMVPRRLKASVPVAYLECLFFNRPDEFALLSQADHTMTIGGKSVPYSNRVQQVANTIKDGVVEYVLRK